MSNKMWGGRFASGPGAIMQEINASIDFDRRLYRQDIAASKAHAAMLAKQGIISRDDAARIAHGLDTILSEMDTGNAAGHDHGEPLAGVALRCLGHGPRSLGTIVMNKKVS